MLPPFVAPQGSWRFFQFFLLIRYLVLKGNVMWQARLQDNYDQSFEQWVAYSEMYGLTERLGFNTAIEAWEANPIIQGSVLPEDFQVVS